MSGQENRIENLFHDVLDLDPEERATFLDKHCKGDAQLRKELDTLLKAEAMGEKLFQFHACEFSGFETVSLEIPLSEGPGTVIGRYKLLEKIGEGGMGVVYMAEQKEPVRRKVALKIIKLGMDSRSIVARFEAERQALSMMDHPNIARVLDGGATETGRSYFVMDLVKGVSITKFCDDSKIRENS